MKMKISLLNSSKSLISNPLPTPLSNTQNPVKLDKIQTIKHNKIQKNETFLSP